MDFEIPESLVHPLLAMIESESPLARQLNQHGACHGSMVVSSALFDSRSLNTLYSLSKANNADRMSFITKLLVQHRATDRISLARRPARRFVRAHLPSPV